MKSTSFTTDIPWNIDPFNTYISKIHSYMGAGDPKNQVRLGIPDDVVSRVDSLNTRWLAVYPKYNDMYNSRTMAITDEVKRIIKEMHLLNDEGHFLARVFISPNATPADLEVFGIHIAGDEAKKARVIPKTPLDQPVQVALKPLGGGSIKVVCSNENGHHSIPQPGNSVQYRYYMGATAPSSANDEKLKQDVSTRASFLFQFGPGNEGLHLFIYLRWYNTKHPDLSGPWGMVQSTIIL